MGQYYKPIILDEEKKKPIVALCSWDYDNGAKLMEHSYVNNNLVAAIEKMMSKDDDGEFAGCPLVWAGDYADAEDGTDDGDNLYCKAEDDVMVKGAEPKHYRYAVNVTKKVYIDTEDSGTFEGTKIHPIPILCSEGNGRGSGDYFGTNMRYVGKWARNNIYFTDSIPEGFKKVTIRFNEDRY